MKAKFGKKCLLRKKKAFFSIWENVLLPVWVFLKGVLSFIGSCIHNTLIFISDTVNSVLHLDYYIVLFWDWFCDTFQVIYYFVKPYVTWFLFDFIGKGLRIFSEANYEFAGYYIPPSDDSFIWWFKTYVFILLPCFMLYRARARKARLCLCPAGEFSILT